MQTKIIILLHYFCVMFSLMSLRILHFSFYKNVLKKIPKDFSKHIVSNEQMELILKYKCTFVWSSYHFNTLFCVILQYPQSKREILRQKEKQYSVKLHDFFCVFYVGWTYILRGSLFIKVVSQWIYATRNLLQCYPLFNLS